MSVYTVCIQCAYSVDCVYTPYLICCQLLPMCCHIYQKISIRTQSNSTTLMGLMCLLNQCIPCERGNGRCVCVCGRVGVYVGGWVGGCLGRCFSRNVCVSAGWMGVIYVHPAKVNLHDSNDNETTIIIIQQPPSSYQQQYV